MLREALSNVARRAAARSVEVELSSADGRVELVVQDDGSGPGDSTRRSGLATMRRRAEQRGGRFSFEPGPRGGTRIVWSVPAA